MMMIMVVFSSSSLGFVTINRWWNRLAFKLITTSHQRRWCWKSVISGRMIQVRWRSNRSSVMHLKRMNSLSRDSSMNGDAFSLLGQYTVLAENPKTGEKVQTSAPLTVRSDATSIDRTAFVPQDAFRTLEAGPNLPTALVQPGVDTNSFLSPDVLRALDQTKPKATEADEKEKPMSPPKVIVPLKPVTCKEGQPINFTAKVEGNPQPTVRLRETIPNVSWSIPFSSPGWKMDNPFRTPIDSGRIMMFPARQFFFKSMEHGQTIVATTL